MADPPEQIIRRYLDEHGGEMDAHVVHILETFGVDERDQSAREQIPHALRQAGVEVDRDLTGLGDEDTVHLAIGKSGSQAVPLSPAQSSQSLSEQPPPSAEIGSPAGWYPDPLGGSGERYWDGSVWSTQVQKASRGGKPDPAAAQGLRSGSSTNGPNGGGGLSGWIRRHPRAVFWTTLGVALVVGIAIGAAAGNDQSELDKKDDQIATLRDQLDSARAKSAELRSSLVTEKGQVARLTAAGEVPSLVGLTLADAEHAAAPFDWNIQTSKQETDSAAPGTIIDQSPEEGTTLKAGRSLNLVIAKKPPPEPPQWVTVATLTGGGGQSKSDEFTVPPGQVRMLYDMPGSGNNAIELYKVPAVYVDLLVNDIGPTSGETRLYQPGRFYLDVTAESYTVQIQVFKRPD